MTLPELLASSLAGSAGMFKMTLADLSDADLLVRPVPGANHGNWQIGHLISAESRMLTGCGAAMPELPAGFAERYTKQTAGIDDPRQFASKAELLALFEKTRNATIAFAKVVTPTQLAAKGPIDFTPTVADCLNMQNGHVSMHVGQLQVLRRKLGKPILF